MINNFLSRTDKTCLIKENPVPTIRMATIKSKPRKLNGQKEFPRLEFDRPVHLHVCDVVKNRPSFFMTTFGGDVMMIDLNRRKASLSDRSDSIEFLTP